MIGTVAIGFLASLPAVTPAPLHLSTTPAAGGAWLNRMNLWRAGSGLTNVTEDATLSQGDYNHAVYMVKTGLITHSEDPTNPYYTASGNTAAQNSNIYVSSSTNTADQQAIDWWMGAPFHATAMLDPRLVTTGFGSYRDSTTSPWQMGAAVNVGSGMSSSGQYPLFYPGDLSTEPLTSYSGNEFPSPQQTGACPGYSGLPVFVEVGPNVSTAVGPIHTLTGNGTALNNCVLDTNNSVVGSYLKWHGAAVMMPQQPLVSGVTYTVALTVNGTPYTWSFTVGPFIISTTPCTSAGLTANLASSQSSGTVVTLTATSMGCPNPQYLFYVQSPGGAWALARNYGGPIWAWNTAGLVPGTYVLNVWVRDTGSGVSVQTNKLLSFTLTSPAACSNAALVPNSASPQPSGTTVTFTASSTVCTQPTYIFYVQTLDGAWNVAQSWGANTFVWNTTGLVAGTYHVDVWARQNGSAAAYESFMNIPYTLTGGAACTATSLSSTGASPQQSGTIVTFTANVTGCPNPEVLYYVQTPNGVWSLAKSYGVPTFTWNTAGLAAGTYRVDAWARQKGSAAPYEAFQNIPYTLTAAVPCTAANLTSDKSSPQPAGTTVIFTATSASCSQPQYLYYVQTPGGVWMVAQTWGSATLTWNTTGMAAGTYHIDAWVRQNGSSAAYETFRNVTYAIS